MDTLSLQPDRDTHLSAYHRGQARLFLTRMTTGHADWIEPLNKLRRDAIAIVRRREGKSPRPETLTDVERLWRRLPTIGRLYPLRVIRERNQFEIIDLRCIPERLRKANDDWDEDDSEPAMMLAAYWLTINRDQAIMDTTVLASVCLHSVGRRYERAADVSDEAAIVDMLALADYAGRNIAEPPGSFIVPLADGRKRWSGERSGFITGAGKAYPSVHHARTFLPR